MLADEGKQFQEILGEELEIAKRMFPDYIVYSQKEGDNTYLMLTLKTLICFTNRESIRQAMNKAHNIVYGINKDGSGR